jgi:transcriptional regulator with XRE-family HTH domain
MAQPLPSYLRSERRKWALTQRELAELLGDISPSVISKYETLVRTPSAETMLGLQVVFGVEPHTLFPALSDVMRRAVIVKAVALGERLADKQDARSLRKRRLLDDMISRSQQTYEEQA